MHPTGTRPLLWTEPLCFVCDAPRAGTPADVSRTLLLEPAFIARSPVLGSGDDSGGGSGSSGSGGGGMFGSAGGSSSSSLGGSSGSDDVQLGEVGVDCSCRAFVIVVPVSVCHCMMCLLVLLCVLMMVMPAGGGGVLLASDPCIPAGTLNQNHFRPGLRPLSASSLFTGRDAHGFMQHTWFHAHVPVSRYCLCTSPPAPVRPSPTPPLTHDC